ncbi:alpha/beta fold hydrolase [Halieaceae bacterium IMCC8485]|uniref:Alpha/beta fold hydrolase n=1 Tax=Candidatus Seongchinamella marina TaxID=2518990 RepID=A0ABT3SXV7_9GAMM|nr:alpha/beta hydrolase [Candidatus Seongchinamella marina]MCX2974450.1 alpha/beta fold hydrolase [Candidatus Seongchinamella marina]
MGKVGLLPEGNYANCANGYKMHYLDEGQGEAVVFLHGSGPGASGHSNFKGNYPALVAAGYRCIVPDHVGYGFSDKPDDVDHPLSFFVECIKQTLDCAEVERCTLVGNSLGGAIAFGLALDYPDLVEKLILMAPGGLSELAEYQKMPGMQKVFQVFGSGEPVTPQVMKDLFATGLMFNPEHATEELVAERMQIMQIMNGHVMATMQVPVLVDRLPEIQCPTLGFWGMDEKMMPEEGIMAMVKNIKHMRTILVNECGHWVMVEHEAMFNRACVDFLQNG